MIPKKHRLAPERAIQTTLARGRGFFDALWTVKVLPQNAGVMVTVVVSTKVSKKAVVRNRIKRLLREVLRLAIPTMRPGHYMILVKPAIVAQLGDSKALMLNFRNFLAKIKIIPS
jgi:ribonuclease P protein component